MHVGNGNLTGKAGEGWTKIEIARREAYGCGDNMRRALNGLSLCVRLGDDDPLVVTSTLGIRISSDARKRFNSELGLDAFVDEEEEMLVTAYIMMQEQGLLIIVLLLERDLRNLSCYLVYDHSDASLSMVSWVPESLEVIGMFRPVPKRTSDGTYELFLLACECDDDRLPLASDMDPSPFLYVFSPVTETNPTCAWEMRRTSRWNVPVSVFERFRTDATFSFQGKGFWADLSQALIYCDLPTASDNSAVDFGFIELPGECQLDLEETLDCNVPMEVTRTIACVGNSIWFVCIRRYEDPADDLVMMWTLELPGGHWKNWARFAVRELWRFDGFKEALLPEAKVGYPVITADGALCLVVAGKVSRYSYSDVSSVDHICTFDVPNKTLLWHGSVHDHIFTQTVAFPPDFFVQRKHGSHNRKFYNLRSAAGPGFAAMA